MDSEKIFQLKQQINKLLEERPELKEFQKEIDKTLSQYGDDKHKRMVALEQMMYDHMHRLTYHMRELSKYSPEDIKS